jgi:hypothetical protein
MNEANEATFDLDERIARTAGPILVVAVAGAMIVWTWMKWPDPLVDFGRELYVPWQITEGRVLYRDVAYFNGPLSPHVNALVYKLLGVSLRSLVIANLAILAVIIAMVWRLWAIIADQLSALLATLALVTIFAFIQLGGIGNYNFVTPYSHELTHGIALSLGAMLCIAAYQRRQRSIFLAGAGLLLGFTFLTKAEVFLAAGIAVGLGVILALWSGRASAPRSAAALTQFAFSFLVAPLGALVMLWLTMPLPDALRGTLGSWWYVFDPDVTQMRFYRRIFGTLDGPNNVHHMVESVIWYAGVFGIVAAAALSLRREQLETRSGRAIAWLGSALLVGGALYSLQRLVRIDWSRAFGGISLVMLILVIGLLVRLGQTWRGRASPRLVMQLVVAMFAIVMLGKIFLSALLYHYGFALAMPAMLVLVAFLTSWWPHFIERRGGSGVVMRGASVAAVLFVIVLHLHFFHRLGSHKPMRVASGADAFWDDLHSYGATGELASVDRRGTAVNLMLDALSHLPRDATLASVPEGTMLNYLSRRPNSTPYINLMPPEVMMFGQDRILRAYEEHPPDYIVLVLKSEASDYGFKGFNRDYGAEIFRWIEANYREVPARTELTYPLVLLERKR